MFHRSMPFCLIVLTTLITGTCLAQTQQDIESALRNEYQGKVLIVRGFYTGAKLEFESNGKIVGDAKNGYWSSDALLKVDLISVRHKYLRLSGHRVLSLFDASEGVFKDSPTNEPLEITIQIDPAWNVLPDFLAAIDRVLTSDRTYLTSGAPEYWGCWLSGRIVRTNDPFGWKCISVQNIPSKPGRGAFRVGGGVSAPRALAAPDPAYTKVAQKAKFQGTSVLFVIIDERGEAAEIRIARPLGGGLDDKAVEAVRSWKFTPAMKDGHPVPVQVNVEVNFRLY